MIEQVPLSKWDFVKVTALCRSPCAKKGFTGNPVFFFPAKKKEEKYYTQGYPCPNFAIELISQLSGTRVYLLKESSRSRRLQWKNARKQN